MSEWSGLEITNNWEPDRKYILTYEIEATEPTKGFTVIGCHNAYFENFSIEVKDKIGNSLKTINSSDTSIFQYNFETGERYFVTVKGTRKSKSFTSDANQNLWI
jgi:hypothetical protein